MSVTLFNNRKKAIVYCFANQKGGVGKTTLAIQFAYYCSQVLRKRVLIIDLDGQGNATRSILAKDAEGLPIYENLIEEAQSKYFFDSDFKDDLEPVHCPWDVDLIGALPNDTELVDANRKNIFEVLGVKSKIKPLRSKYDIIILDCPPTNSTVLFAALTMTNYVIAPVGLGYAIDGLCGIAQSCEDVQIHREQAYPCLLGAVFNRVRKVSEAKETLSEIKKAMPDMLFDTTLGDRSGIEAASYSGTPIWKQRYNYVAGCEVSKFCAEIIKKTEICEKEIGKGNV